ncbi:hypothetical protein ACFQ5J_06610 [Lacticaseibacillus baoqingensis]|uniref:Uncharacterized protein n=1 Tax=Lacticaseibacillus baoqingensis TaxID=2486013 RepID=A0ABW4E8W8_9LACO|nr:hypothetical protein [Lacticaseibacillus baoqingensis]
MQSKRFRQWAAETFTAFIINNTQKPYPDEVLHAYEAGSPLKLEHLGEQ